MDEKIMSDGARLVRVETICEHVRADVTELKNSFKDDLVEIKKSIKQIADSQMVCVRRDDPGYFSKHMREYNESLLKKKVGWVTVLDIGFKFIVFAAALFMGAYGIAHW